MDIFGKNLNDYAHLRHIRKEGGEDVLRAHMDAQQERFGQEYQWDALGNPGAGGWKRADDNSGALGYVMNNLVSIATQVDEVLYAGARSPKLVPVDSSPDERAATFGTVIMDRVGRGAPITNDGSDAPTARVRSRLEQHRFIYGGIDAIWNIEDLRLAAFTGVALDTETIQAATEGAMEHIDELCVSGDDRTAYTTGLINQATGTGDTQVHVSSPSSTFASFTPDALLSFLQREIADFVNDSEEIFGMRLRGELVIALPSTQYDRVVNARMNNPGETIWSYLRTRNSWTDPEGDTSGNSVSVRRITELTDAAANGTDDRGILYFRHPRVMVMGEAFSPRPMEAFRAERTVTVPIEYKVSGLVMKRTAGMRYWDNV